MPHCPEDVTARCVLADDAPCLGRAGDGLDDARFTIGSCGDPLLRGDTLFDVMASARDAGIGTVHSDQLAPADRERLRRLARAPLDFVSVHLPAMSVAMYRDMIGVDAYSTLLDNVRLFLTERQQLNAGGPLLAPIFTKCR